MEPSMASAFPKLPIWKWGRPAEIWIRHMDVVQSLIREQNLKPVDLSHHVPDMWLTANIGAEAARLPGKRIPFPGGIRIPHLHFQGELYLLNREQWKSFSEKLVKDFQAKLTQAQQLSFDQVMELSEGLSSIA